MTVTRQRISVDAEMAIITLLREGVGSAAKIHSRMMDSPFDGKVPSVRSIFTIITKARSRDDTEEWAALSADLSAFSLVADIWADVYLRDLGLTIAEAQWVARLSHTRPDWSTYAVWWLAGMLTRLREDLAKQLLAECLAEPGGLFEREEPT